MPLGRVAIASSGQTSSGSCQGRSSNPGSVTAEVMLRDALTVMGLSRGVVDGTREAPVECRSCFGKSEGRGCRETPPALGLCANRAA